jgi:hypothetical protein
LRVDDIITTWSRGNILIAWREAVANGTLNAHWAFHEAPKSNDFLSAIKVLPRDESALRQAREEIRAALRAGLGTWQSVVAKAELFEREFVRTSRAAPTLRPRFRLQGSFAYFTVNNPAHKPPQRVDQDDGVYMPTEFILVQGNNRPILSSKGYFRAVESILEPLCKKKGWTLNKDKNSCVRVEISPSVHIDLPLYAIPAEEFTAMADSVEKGMARDAARALSESEELGDEYYRALLADRLMLAHRETGWEVSDPRKIEDWFRQAIETHGEVVRRICRYLKAWRDHHWQRCTLSSLALMACVVSTLDGLKGDPPSSRDDLLLLLVTEQLASRLSQPLPNPVMPYDNTVALDRDWTPALRAEFVSKAAELHRRVAGALNGTDDASTALRELRAAFGGRMTDDVSVIRFQQREAVVKSFAKTTVAAPMVPRSTSG